MSGTPASARELNARKAAAVRRRVHALHAILSSSTCSRTVEGLAAEMGVSRWTMRRDLKRLRDRGLVVWVQQGRYRASGVDTVPL